MLGVANLTNPCEARRFHVPQQPFPDSHHVVPRAWQAAWKPEHAVVQIGGESAGLWHPETVELCPNCHRRVHVAIQQMMRAIPEPAGRLNDPLAARKGAWGTKRMNREQAIAYQALTAWVQAGGSLEDLRRKRLFGIQ